MLATTTGEIEWLSLPGSVARNAGVFLLPRAGLAASLSLAVRRRTPALVALLLSVSLLSGWLAFRWSILTRSVLVSDLRLTADRIALAVILGAGGCRGPDRAVGRAPTAATGVSPGQDRPSAPAPAPSPRQLVISRPGAGPPSGRTRPGPRSGSGTPASMRVSSDHPRRSGGGSSRPRSGSEPGVDRSAAGPRHLRSQSISASSAIFIRGARVSRNAATVRQGWLGQVAADPPAGPLAGPLACCRRPRARAASRRPRSPRDRRALWVPRRTSRRASGLRTTPAPRPTTRLASSS